MSRATDLLRCSRAVGCAAVGGGVFAVRRAGTPAAKPAAARAEGGRPARRGHLREGLGTVLHGDVDCKSNVPVHTWGCTFTAIAKYRMRIPCVLSDLMCKCTYDSTKVESLE